MLLIGVSTESWLIPIECVWGTNKEQEEKGNENPKSGLSSNCRKWSHNDASGWHGKEKQVNRVRSSSSSTLVATDVDTKNAEKSWLGMVVGISVIKQFSVYFVTSVHVCPKSYATYATLSLKVWGMRQMVYNEMSLHGEVFTVKVFAVLCEGRRLQLLSMIWWEIEGFLLTVGDVCRKLGGHGREMILRRDGDSHLMNVEFKSELQWCKSPMLRDLTGLVTHEHMVLLLLMRMRRE